MHTLTREDLKLLVEHRNGPCISIYLRTHLPGEKIHQDVIKLKNTLRQASERLASEGWRSVEVDSLLKPAGDLLNDSLFWQEYSGGIAFFLSWDIFQVYHVPDVGEDLLFVGNSFHTKPLLPRLFLDGRFYVLALSQKHVRMYQGSRDFFHEMRLPPGVPANISRALGEPDFQQQIQHHAAKPVGRGAISAVFHGQGPDVYHPKEQLAQFYKKIDHGLRHLLHDRRNPLVLAGVEANFPIYRSINSYPHLLEHGVPGSAEEIVANDLHRKAWEVVEPHILRRQNEAAQTYRELTSTGRTSARVEEIVPAAFFGRVDKLFVALGQQKWGSFNPKANFVELHPQQLPGDKDLLDFAAIQTFLNGGHVYAVSQEGLPEKSSQLAAVFRY